MSSEIKELVTGRELDALVAENVMGCVVRWSEMVNVSGRNLGSFPNCGCKESIHNGPFIQIPNYSTSIADAFEAIKYIHENWIFSKRDMFCKNLKDQFYGSDLNITVAWPEALFRLKPEHICRAALKVVEDEA